MALTANPFHPTTGELLPGYRDAYIRGDLAGKNAELVDAYLKANPTEGVEAFRRSYALQGQGHDIRPVGWLQNQLQLIQTEPARFRQRAGTFLLVCVLLSGAVFANNTLSNNPKESPVTLIATTAAKDELTVTEATARKMTTISGRILDENGRALIGATVLNKANNHGVSTDAQGNYTLAIPANQPANLQFAYGGYTEEEMQVRGRSVQTVTLLPRTDYPVKAKRRWWLFNL